MVVIGTVHRPHGLKGEVSAELVPGFPGELKAGSKVTWVGGERSRALTVAAARPHAGRLLVFFEGVEGVDAARELSGGSLCVAEAPPAPPDFYYSHEVAGWSCEDPSGRALGVAAAVEETPAGPLLSLETPEGRTVLVPFVRPLIVEIDRVGRKIVLDLPEGLMELS